MIKKLKSILKNGETLGVGEMFKNVMEMMNITNKIVEVK